jgi:hypothetical protein
MVGIQDTLLSFSSVKLYGRLVAGLNVDLTGARDELGANKFLREQLDPALYPDDRKPKFARIYGFSHAGIYTALQRPVIMLVHGEGEQASPPAVRADKDSANGTTPSGDARFFLTPGTSLAPATGTPDLSGVAAKSWEFSFNIKVWEYDRGDFSLRLDVDSGPLERILLEPEAGGDDRMPYFGNRAVRRRGPGE